MADRSFLGWPFFAEQHRRFADEIAGWAQSQPRGSHADVNESTRTWVRALGAAGWLRYCVPAGYGGALKKLDVRTLCLAREALGYHDALADFGFAMQGLGSGAITFFGSEELKRQYLPRVGAGEAIAAFALSEAEAGSDVSALATTAVREGDGFRIDGAKTWISNAGIADFYVVFARTGPAHSAAKGLSAFVVNAQTPGLEVGERIETIAPHPLASLTFEKCVIPAANLLGEEGQGFKIAMATLDVFRSTVGAAALGFARRAMDESISHVRTRKLFGAPLSALQMTQAKIADMATAIDASALLIYRAAWTKDSGAARITREAAMAKLFATESAHRVIDDAVQLFGGRGVTRGEIVESLYRDIRALRIYEGASEVQKIVIARATLEAGA
ncbi:MAG: acyl-CoA dehydrogenase family protein [Candidatus Eremiobacteraeota bacterium]|nr:acyl-CoA dehydrogenase family protein [Candidatus Eremiobacteraeota bacterium]